MKNVYFIAIKDKETLEPILIKRAIHDDISFIGRNYRRAYTFETKQKAEETRRERYKQYEEKQKQI